MKRVAIYVRVSTDVQTTQNQERELQAVAERARWTVVEVYRDAGISGAKGREQRPAFDALCKDAARRKFDMVAAWSVDRLSRSLHDLTGFLNDLHALRVDLYLHGKPICCIARDCPFNTKLQGPRALNPLIFRLIGSR